MICFLCGDDVTERPSVRVDFEGSIAEVCTDCLEQADEPERDAPPDLNREGLPEFTGVFG